MQKFRQPDYGLVKRPPVARYRLVDDRLRGLLAFDQAVAVLRSLALAAAGIVPAGARNRKMHTWTVAELFFSLVATR